MQAYLTGTRSRRTPPLFLGSPAPGAPPRAPAAAAAPPARAPRSGLGPTPPPRGELLLPMPELVRPHPQLPRHLADGAPTREHKADRFLLELRRERPTLSHGLPPASICEYMRCPPKRGSFRGTEKTDFTTEAQRAQRTTPYCLSL